MRILLLSSSYLPVLGGLQTVTHTLAKNLIQLGDDVVVVTHRYPRDLAASEIIDGVPINRWLFLTPEVFINKRLDLFIASLFYGISVRIKLIWLMSVFRPDVVNFHFPNFQIPFVLWLRRMFKFRLVVSVHGDEIETWTQILDTQEESAARELSPDLKRLQAILDAADAVTACSGYLLDRAGVIQPSVGGKGTVIYNGFDPARFQDQSKYAHPRPYVFAFGRFTHKKGFDLLIDAFKQAASANPGVDLVIAGNGEELPKLKEQVHRLGLKGRVVLIGRASSQQVVQLLNGCEFLVVPSRKEPFGIVVLEGLAAGKPVLATRVGGIVELFEMLNIRNDAQPPIEELSGVQLSKLVPATIDGLAQGMQSLLVNLHGEPSFNQDAPPGLMQFVWANVVEQYQGVYQSAKSSEV